MNCRSGDSAWAPMDFGPSLAQPCARLFSSEEPSGGLAWQVSLFPVTVGNFLRRTQPAGHYQHPQPSKVQIRKMLTRDHGGVRLISSRFNTGMRCFPWSIIPGEQIACTSLLSAVDPGQDERDGRDDLGSSLAAQISRFGPDGG